MKNWKHAKTKVFGLIFILCRNNSPVRHTEHDVADTCRASLSLIAINIYSASVRNCTGKHSLFCVLVTSAIEPIDFLSVITSRGVVSRCPHKY